MFQTRLKFSGFGLGSLKGIGKTLGSAARTSAPIAIGAGIPLATAGGFLLADPAIRSNVGNILSGKGSTEEMDARTPLPENTLATADQIGQVFAAHGVDPTKMRVAVDAVPGTGKTTLSRAMAGRLGMKHFGLDWLPNDGINSLMGNHHIESMPRLPSEGEILEHNLLLRTYDPEVFDAAIHIHKDPEEIHQQLINRGRSAASWSLTDYPKSQAVGQLAFDTLAGDPIDLGNGTLMKLRPQAGWGTERLDQMLAAKGINPGELSRHEKLLSLHMGRREHGQGSTPYMKSPFSNAETAAVAGSIPLGVVAAMMAKKWLRR